MDFLPSTAERGTCDRLGWLTGKRALQQWGVWGDGYEWDMCDGKHGELIPRQGPLEHLLQG